MISNLPFVHRSRRVLPWSEGGLKLEIYIYLRSEFVKKKRGVINEGGVILNEYGISTTEICFPMYRRLWNWFEYIFFFYNAIVGIVASILRVFLSVTVNLLLLFRLDAVIFMKGFEFMDSGMSHILASILYVKATRKCRTLWGRA